ncbi:MAG: 2-succinyl-5-enolpyruvyl-6-hydroxy-3-cyclohexene-1-carboxylic-acid synthase [Cyclobacteriaceae bacterium]|nr:2-succinyl-5-enolpyruvyl-6-hydroxy-3-cyclohexene-1-carboxylic-acid synthase [Cyclobacteriaceae bacterium]
MSAHQPIFDIAAICAAHGIQQAVVCPGSRCAPLTLAFTSHPAIQTRTFSDERSAAFVALGIAQQTQTPTVLVCTSGSAAYNFAPAVAEAFYQQIPLLIFTADRPAEWIDQWDGQTIRQENIYGAHVKHAYSLPTATNHSDSIWHIHRLVNEAILLSTTFPAGPVHINVPLREPLYPAAGEAITFSKNLKVTTLEKTNPTLTIESLAGIRNKLSQYTKIMVVAGQQEKHTTLLQGVSRFCKQHGAALLGDVISNFHPAEETVRLADVFLAHANENLKAALQPELLITFGKSVISKNLKQFLRSYAPVEHWHIQPGGYVPDPFQSLTKTIACHPLDFFNQLTIEHSERQDSKNQHYLAQWQAVEQATREGYKNYFATTGFHELDAVQTILKNLPAHINLHAANSMSVRYLNLVGLTAQQKDIHVYANRGTSGIDGCTSTAVGHSLISNAPQVLLTGDLAFFYDRNAFWHNYKMPNLRVVVLNNQGGVIFNLIDGPGAVPQKDEFFVTHQALSARHLAQEFNHTYLTAGSKEELTEALREFFIFDGSTKILEIKSTQQQALIAFNDFKQVIKKSYAT